MAKEQLPVSRIFENLVSQGHIAPTDHMEVLRLPGEYLDVPSIATYGIPDTPNRSGGNLGAKLGQRS